MKILRKRVIIGGGLFLLLFIITVSVSISSFPIEDALIVKPIDVWVSLFKFFSNNSLNTVDKIALFRFQRVLAALLSGILLAVGGTFYQTILMNPLVDPYLLGVSAGASLGAVIAYRFSLPGPVWLYSFPFAILAFAVSYLLGRGNKLRIVLSGVVVSALLSSIITLILIMWNNSLHNVMAWLMGSFSMADWEKIVIQFIVVVFVGMFSIVNLRILDIILIGDEVAHSVGVDIYKSKLMFLIVASLSATFVASFFGIISFIGLMAPHIARLLVGDSHFYKLIVASQIGAILLILGDFLSRSILYPMEVPIGVFTSFVGAMFFLYLVFRGEWL